MRKSIITTAAIMAVLLISGATGSAQDKKQIEKRITVVSVNEDGVTRDTTIIQSDTILFEDGNLIIDTREGKRMIHKPGERSRMVWTTIDDDFSTPLPAPGRMTDQMRVARLGREKMDGVMYHISVDGVMVTIRAPGEKSKEADQILEEVRKILMKK